MLLVLPVTFYCVYMTVIIKRSICTLGATKDSLITTKDKAIVTKEVAFHKPVPFVPYFVL